MFCRHSSFHFHLKILFLITSIFNLLFNNMATLCWMPTTSMKSDIGHNLLCPTIGYSVFKETILPTTHMKISSNRLLDHAIKGGAIRCDVQHIRSLDANAGTELSMETPEVGSTDQLKIALKNSLQGVFSAFQWLKRPK